MEPQFAMNVALAATVVSRGKLFPPVDKTGVESPAYDTVSQVVVTSVGHWRGEGLALVEVAT
jgi:3-oxoacyl-[acyl-carrier-protein] synthase II